MSNNEVLISIIIPCYNADKFISQGIQSVVNQPMQNYELIIVDDGSIDNSSQICKDFCNRYPNIKYYYISNHGAGYARNFGIKKATGKWIMFLDADDLYLPDTLNSNLEKKLENYSRESVDIIYTSKCESDLALQTPIGYYSLDSYHFNPIPDLEFWAAIYNHSFLIQKNTFFFEYKEQDIESAFRYRTISKANKIIKDNKICFYLRRINPVSNINTWNLFTMHCIKAMCYQHLFDECQKMDDKDWLFEIVQTEINEFYKCCMINKCENKEYLDQINELFLNSRKAQSEYRRSLKMDSKYWNNHILYPLANISQKRKKDPFESKANKVNVIFPKDDIIMKRLRAIGIYLKECILSQ